MTAVFWEWMDHLATVVGIVSAVLTGLPQMMGTR
jgi:hypothetical protein